MSGWSRFAAQLSLTQKFNLWSLGVLVVSALGLGWWVGREIEVGVINRTAATTALYINSFLEPQLQNLAQEPFLSVARMEALDRLLHETPLHQQVVRFKVWGRKGLVLYSSNITQVGRRFPVDDDLALAWQRGLVSTGVTTLDRPENEGETKPRPRLLETYAPIRLRGTDQVIAVAEFYAIMDDLEREVASAKWRSWLIVGLVTLGVYVLLISFVRRSSNTILRQQAELGAKVTALNVALGRNAELSERVRRAATRTTALNERFLRRVSAELHDGPAQDLSFALLRLDGLMHYAADEPSEEGQRKRLRDLEAMEGSLKRAVGEMRAIASDLRLPELDPLSLRATLERAVRDHERRSETRVELRLRDVPECALLPVKITAFRIAQEALNNSFRHAGGVGQRVTLEGESGSVRLEVADDGPGFVWSQHLSEGHLGLIGMRERVESLGGEFQLESVLGRGTRIVVRLPLVDVPMSPTLTEVGHA
jgi:signal transduction histidine kinase